MPVSQKVRLSRLTIPVSYSLGGGAEHVQCLCIRNRYQGPKALSNQTAQGSGFMLCLRTPVVFICLNFETMSQSYGMRDETDPYGPS